MKGPTLVIMAAGMGSRYGGLKQMDRIGLGGEALLDYSVYDALRSGFTQAVFIIRHDIEKDFKEIVLNRLGPRLPYRLAFQETCSLIPADLLEGVRRTGRTKPWGTTHALLCAAPLIDAPFAVINADDFYGRPAFEAMAKFLSVPDCREGALVPYRLEKTLSSTGSVTRGVCAIRDGFLVSVEELMGLEKQGRAILNTGPGGERRELPPDAPVSMNFWGFPTAIFPDLERYFLEFISASWGDLKSECYLPLAVDRLIKNNLLKVRALSADSDWFGITYQEDRAAAAAHIEASVKEGVYPPRLWE